MKNDELRKAVSSKDRLITRLQQRLEKAEREKAALFCGLMNLQRKPDVRVGTRAEVSERLAQYFREANQLQQDAAFADAWLSDMQEILDTAAGIAKLPF